MLGLPTKAYPEGEFLQRSLKDDFERAYKAYDEGNVQALTNFFEIHPEYEARLALFKEPEERMRQYLVDHLWDKWNDLPTLTRKEIQDQLGSEFSRAFLEKETRSYESIPVENLQIWLKLIGGDPPGTLSAPVTPLELAPPEIAHRAQVFYDMRKSYFPDYYDIQDTYFKLSEKGKARKKFLEEHPELVSYWDWRRDWFHRNPDVVPYLTDKEYEFQYESEEQAQQYQAMQPNFTWQEWQTVLSPPLQNIVLDYVYGGEELPDSAQYELEKLSDQIDLSPEAMLALIERSLQ